MQTTNRTGLLRRCASKPTNCANNRGCALLDSLFWPEQRHFHPPGNRPCHAVRRVIWITAFCFASECAHSSRRRPSYELSSIVFLKARTMRRWGRPARPCALRRFCGYTVENERTMWPVSRLGYQAATMTSLRPCTIEQLPSLYCQIAQNRNSSRRRFTQHGHQEEGGVMPTVCSRRLSIAPTHRDRLRD